MSSDEAAGRPVRARRVRSENPAFSPQRLQGMVLRHFYLLRGSLPRVLELAYWPTVQMVLWGFITQFFATQSTYVAQAFGVLLSGVLLWDILFRSQLGVTVSFLEEMWSRNLAQLLVTPVRPFELVLGFMTVSLMRTVIGSLPATVLAIFFYGFSIYSLGLPLVGFFTLLVVFGWSVGIALNGLLLRYGLGAESLAWVVIFAIAPVSGVYYPISVLPGWLQPVSWCLPSAYVFEGMRAVLIDGVVRYDLMAAALALDAVIFTACAGFFLLSIRHARRTGSILGIGE